MRPANVHVHPDVCSLNTLVGLDERGSQAKPTRTIDISPIRRPGARTVARARARGRWPVEGKAKEENQRQEVGGQNAGESAFARPRAPPGRRNRAARGGGGIPLPAGCSGESWEDPSALEGLPSDESEGGPAAGQRRDERKKKDENLRLGLATPPPLPAPFVHSSFRHHVVTLAALAFTLNHHP